MPKAKQPIEDRESLLETLTRLITQMEKVDSVHGFPNVPFAVLTGWITKLADVLKQLQNK